VLVTGITGRGGSSIVGVRVDAHPGGARLAEALGPGCRVEPVAYLTRILEGAEAGRGGFERPEKGIGGRCGLAKNAAAVAVEADRIPVVRGQQPRRVSCR